MATVTPRQPRRPPANLVALASARQRGLIAPNAESFLQSKAIKLRPSGHGGKDKSGTDWHNAGVLEFFGFSWGSSSPRTRDAWDTYRGASKALTLLGQDPAEIKTTWKAGGEDKQQLRLLAKTVYLFNAQERGKMPKKAAKWFARHPDLYAQVKDTLAPDVEKMQREAAASYRTEALPESRGSARGSLFEGPPWASTASGPPGGVSKKRGARATIIGGGLGGVA